MWAILNFSPNPSGFEIPFLSTLRLCKRLLLTSAGAEKKSRFQEPTRKFHRERAQAILTFSPNPSGLEIPFLSTLCLCERLLPTSADAEKKWFFQEPHDERA